MSEPKLCPSCGERLGPASFRLWTGRCPTCSCPISPMAISEEAQTAPATSSEIRDYLCFKDELDAIRLGRRADRSLFVVSLVVVAYTLVGRQLGYIHGTYGTIGLIAMSCLWLAVHLCELRRRCPRCREPFHYHAPFGVKTRETFRMKCGSCGLRNLSQDDFRRLVRNELEDRLPSECG